MASTELRAPQSLHQTRGGSHCAAADRFPVATRRGRYPHTDDGVEVRRVFHKLRSLAIENFNGQFKAIFDPRGSVLTRGLVRPQRFALGAVFVYQLVNTTLASHQ